VKSGKGAGGEKRKGRGPLRISGFGKEEETDASLAAEGDGFFAPFVFWVGGKGKDGHNDKPRVINSKKKKNTQDEPVCGLTEKKKKVTRL